MDRLEKAMPHLRAEEQHQYALEQICEGDQ